MAAMYAGSRVPSPSACACLTTCLWLGGCVVLLCCAAVDLVVQGARGLNLLVRLSSFFLPLAVHRCLTTPCSSSCASFPTSRHVLTARSSTSAARTPSRCKHTTGWHCKRPAVAATALQPLARTQHPQRRLPEQEQVQVQEQGQEQEQVQEQEHELEPEPELELELERAQAPANLSLAPAAAWQSTTPRKPQID